ncbi:hypothetical protein KOR42_00670 [Thalassoglobus neptunius]|uniref:DUF58 domain-containing protein n=1 Tax=Thalassoglobus neptunius TaxID=1938619 RepID=A0A5C5X3D9_9PLAN|nr:DUF58 domain-containing protein [Thalassoglobus neptunius]TWT56713.1 hypothetical protein KOR42_00670 [Thalassoglobus neptunius]
MAKSFDDQLPPEAISRISRLEIQARQVVEGFLSGQHRSPYFGQSIEFVQHREYVAGDDIRRVDWKVWSKTDKYYIKQYEEETNLRTSILVDASESMQFGSGDSTKFDYASTVAAALTYLLLRQQDAVSLSIFDEEIRTRTPSRSQQTHLGAILSVLAVQNPSQKTDMSQILRAVADEKSQRGMVVAISDLFVPPDDLFKGLRMLRKRGHDVLLFHILDDQELDFDFSGTTRFEGLEESGSLTCDPKSLREGYQNALQEFLEELRTRCARNVIDYQTIRTSEPIDAVLRHYMNHRVGLRGSLRQ